MDRRILDKVKERMTQIEAEIFISQVELDMIKMIPVSGDAISKAGDEIKALSQTLDRMNIFLANLKERVKKEEEKLGPDNTIQEVS